MKLRLYWTLAALATLILGCGGEPAANNETSSAGGAAESNKLTVGVVFDSGGTGDKSFNDSAAAGIDRAVKELGVEKRLADSASENDYEPNLETLAGEGKCDIVFAIGINMQKALEKVAPKHPDVKFAIVDAKVEGKNVRSLLFKEEEGSFLAGYLAGLMTKTGKIGFVGGQEIPLIKKFYYGYAAGAKTANPGIVILPEKYTGSWDNVDVAKVAAKTLFSGGADIVYHAAGRAGLGVIRAAKEAGLYAIGVDSDQDYLAEGNVLTSMIKRVDESVFQTISDVKNGKFTAEAKVYDLKANGVGLSPMTYTKDKIGEANLKKIEEVKAKIIEGKIVVPATKEQFEAFKAPAN